MPAIDAKVKELDMAIGRHQAAIERLEGEMQSLQRKIDYNRRRLRELGQQRGVELTFKLPL